MSEVSMLNVRNYSSYFLYKNKSLDSQYIYAASDEEWDRLSTLSGDVTNIDTPLEIALLSSCAGVVDIRPVAASNMLGNAKQADLKFGAAVYQEIQILRFLGNTAAVGLHEGELKFIIDKGNVTRAEIEAYYRNGIRSLIADAVNAEFNRISFLIENRSSTHTAVLTYSSNSGYTLNYGGTYTNEEIRKITAPTLDALLAEIGRRKTDFDQTGIDQVSSQAALIPAIRLGSQSLDDIVAILANFYSNPTQGSFNAVKDVSVLYEVTRLRSGNDLFEIIDTSYYNTIFALNQELARKVSREASTTIVALTREQQQRLVSVQD